MANRYGVDETYEFWVEFGNFLVNELGFSREGVDATFANVGSLEEWLDRYGKYSRDDWPRIEQYLTEHNSEFLKKRAEEERQAKAREALDAFYQEMLTPFDPSDPRYARILNAVQSRTSTAAYNRGIGGGLAESAVARALADAALGIQHQREMAGLQALGMSLQDANQAMDVRRQLEQQARERAHADAMAKYAYQQQMASGLGALVGGGIGALGFLVPGLGAVTMPAGAQLGGSIGGMLAGPPPSYSDSWRGV